MTRKRPLPIERTRQMHAYEVYRDLGYGRTFRAVSREVDASAGTISKWAQWYKWDERIAEYKGVVAKREEAGDILKPESPIARKVVRAMEQVEAAIDGAFTSDTTGKTRLREDIRIKSVDELTKLVDAYRKYLITYNEFIAAHMPDRKSRDKATSIKELNINIGNMSQQERIALMGGIVSGNVDGGNKQPAGGSQDADFTEVSERGDEDGSGCDGVSGSPEGSGSGDEGTVRES